MSAVREVEEVRATSSDKILNHATASACSQTSIPLTEGRKTLLSFADQRDAGASRTPCKRGPRTSRLVSVSNLTEGGSVGFGIATRGPCCTMTLR